MSASAVPKSRLVSKSRFFRISSRSGGSADIIHTLEGGLARGVLVVFKGMGGWVKKDQKRQMKYVQYTAPN